MLLRKTKPGILHKPEIHVMYCRITGFWYVFVCVGSCLCVCVCVLFVSHTKTRVTHAPLMCRQGHRRTLARKSAHRYPSPGHAPPRPPPHLSIVNELPVRRVEGLKPRARDRTWCIIVFLEVPHDGHGPDGQCRLQAIIVVVLK